MDTWDLCFYSPLSSTNSISMDARGKAGGNATAVGREEEGRGEDRRAEEGVRAVG